MATPPDPRRERELFAEALALSSPAERAAYLRGACGNDPAMHRRLEALLAAHESQSRFLPEPSDAGGPATEIGEAKPTEQAGSMIGRYKLLEKLGEGGFGSVWAAEQREPVKRRVALKIIKLGMDTRQVVARFEAERQALALMDHPNIARVLDAGSTEAGRPYFVMELVKGIPFTKYCDREKLGTRDRLDLFIKVCHAIQHAHQKGIIHRDIKPSNILVTLHDGVPVPKVIDFGIAKATQQELTELTIYTQHHQFIGTPAYMSPEQAEMSGLDIDTRSDIYSLGVLLYELLTGSTPFNTRELMQSGIDEMRRIIREKEPVRPSTRLTQVQAGSDNSKIVIRHSSLATDLDWIVMKCLEKDRGRRYETANGLAADLKRHLNHEPVVARPPSTAYRFQKAWKRNRLVFTAGAAVAAALVIGLGISAWQTVRATLAKREQTRLREVAVKALDGEKEQRAQSQSAQERSRRLLYASDMNLAQQALTLNNLGKARRLLDRHQPQPGEEDLRGWEWRYLWQLTRSSALVTLTNRPVRGFSVSFSPDGRLLAVGWFDGRVELWDVPGRRLLRVLTEVAARSQGRVAFSPVGNLLAATSEAKVVTLYDLDSGKDSILWRSTADGTPDVRDLEFSPDGSRVVIYAGRYAVSPASAMLPDEVWVANVKTARIEAHVRTLFSEDNHFGAARLSADNRRLYLARSDYESYRYSIQCVDLATSHEVWQTELQRDQGLTTLALSPDGLVLASGSGYEDPTIRIWDAATGRLLVRLNGHTGWVGKLVFTRDGKRLISVAADQSLRFWDTTTWTETRVLRGHTDEIHAVDVSESAQLVASASKDGDLVLWKEDGRGATDGPRLLPVSLGSIWDFWNDRVIPLDHSRLLMLRSGRPSALLDLKRDQPLLPVPDLGSPTNVLGFFGTNMLCQWNGTNQIVVHEWRGADFVRRGAITLESGSRPGGFAFNPRRQLLAWTEGTSPMSVFLAGLATPNDRTELKDKRGGVTHLYFSEDGNYLAASHVTELFLHVWNVETGQLAISLEERVRDWTFSADSRGLIAIVGGPNNDHELQFHDLVHGDRPPRIIRGRHFASGIAISPVDGLVASATGGGEVRLLDGASGAYIGSVHGHMNAIFGLSFSPDGRRLTSSSGGREAVKLLDVGTRQELLTLSGAGSTLAEVRWTADGDAIISGPPWQVWRAPSWDEIAAEELKDKQENRSPNRARPVRNAND